MDVQMLTQYFLRYGAVFIFVIILLEYMNLPGFPAGIIMPLAGIWAARGQISFFMVMALGLAAGLLGSWILYGIGRMGGDLFLDRYLKRFPKHEPVIQRNFELLRTRGAAGIFIPYSRGSWRRMSRNIHQQADSHDSYHYLYSCRCHPDEFC